MPKQTANENANSHFISIVPFQPVTAYQGGPKGEVINTFEAPQLKQVVNIRQTQVKVFFSAIVFVKSVVRWLVNCAVQKLTAKQQLFDKGYLIVDI